MGEIADAFRAALAGKRPPAGVRTRVLVRAEDTGEAFTLELGEGAWTLEEGETESAGIRILGDGEAILALTRLRLRPGDDALRLVLKRQLGGELTIRGLVLRPRRVLQLIRLLGRTA